MDHRLAIVIVPQESNDPIEASHKKLAFGTDPGEARRSRSIASIPLKLTSFLS